MQMPANRTSTADEPTPPGFDPTGAMAGSVFLAKVWGKFYNSTGQSIWPGQPMHDHDARATAELPVALSALFGRAAFGDEMPAADSTTALGKLNEAAAEADWPANAAIPDTWDPELIDTYRLYEVGCAVSILIQAFHDSGGGGGPRTYPPPPDNP